MLKRFKNYLLASRIPEGLDFFIVTFPRLAAFKFRYHFNTGHYESAQFKNDFLIQLKRN